MANLTIPNPEVHKYIIGIDFGHGETSAAICSLEWGKEVTLIENLARDIRINPNSKTNDSVLVSAISQVGNELAMIGDDAFSAAQINNGAYIRVCFKEKPTDICGHNEQLMIQYMRAVYERIRKVETDLTDNNHIVYIARPSGWVSEECKEIYRNMAIQAGIPLGGLTSESRAAIFYAINNPRIGFAKEIKNGAIVFDLGSSTLDFTYLSNENQPIDYGYPYGASIVEKVIYSQKIGNNEGVQKLLNNSPQYKDKLLFEARKIKEDVFSRNNINAEIDSSFALKTLITKECELYNELKRVFVDIEYENLEELSNSVEEVSGYITKLKEALINFRENHIAGKPLMAVFITGGASRMLFISETIKEVYGLSDEQVRIDPDNPSLTISRGIAMLGCADCISLELEKQLIKESETLPIDDIYNNLVNDVSSKVSNGVWDALLAELKRFSISESNISLNQLTMNIQKAIDRYSNVNIPLTFSDAITNTLEAEAEKIISDLNKLIKLYMPDRQINLSKLEISSIKDDALTKKINGQISGIINRISGELVNNMSEIIGDIIWTALGIFLWGVFYLGYKALKFGWEMLTTTQAEREAAKAAEEAKKRAEVMAKKLSKEERLKAYNEFMANKDEHKELIQTNVRSLFSNNKSIKSSIAPQLRMHLKEMIENNIKDIRIPIE